MNPSPPKRTPLPVSEAEQGGNENQLAEETLPLHDTRVNGKELAPDGFCYVYAEDGSRETVPVEMHPTLAPGPEKLTQERIALRAVLEWVLFCNGHPGKVCAFYFVIGEDKRGIDEIVAAFDISEKTFFNWRKECSVWFEGFKAAIESEVTP